MFDPFNDNRTEEERRRDREYADKRLQRKLLAMGFAEGIRKLMNEHGGDDVAVGLVGEGLFAPELLVQSDGVTYKISVSVDHDD